MESRSTVMDQVALFLDSSEKRKGLLNSLFNTYQDSFTESVAGSLFDLIYSLKEELMPEEILHYLSIQDGKSGNTVAMAIASNEPIRKKYLELLYALTRRGYALSVVTHLLLENNQLQTIAHVYPIQELIPVLCLLKEKINNEKCLDHLLFRADKKGITVIEQAKRMAATQPAEFLKLIEAEVIPADAYPMFAENLTLIINHIKKLSADEKQQKWSSLPLQLFIHRAAIQKATLMISNARMTRSSWTIETLQNDNDRTTFIKWLHDENELPLTARIACLEVEVKNADKPRCLANCLTEHELESYFAILKIIINDASKTSFILKQLAIIEETHKANIHEHLATYFHLLTELLNKEAAPNIINNHILHGKISIPHYYRHESKQVLSSYWTFLEKLIEKNVDIKNIRKVMDGVLNIKQTCNIMNQITISLDRKPFIAFLIKLASRGSEAANLIADVLLETVNYDPYLSAITTLLTSNKNDTENIIRLLIALNKKGVSPKKLNLILSQKYNDKNIAGVLCEILKNKIPLLCECLENNIVIPDIKDEKEKVLAHILKLPQRQCVKMLIYSLSESNPASGLNLFFCMKRGLAPTHFTAGSLAKIKSSLDEGILSKKYVNDFAALLQECSEKNDAITRKHILWVISRLAVTNIGVLLKFLKQDLIPHTSYADIVNILYSEKFDSYFKSLSDTNRRSLLIDYLTDKHPIRVFMQQLPHIKILLDMLAEDEFGNQDIIASGIKKRSAKVEAPLQETRRATQVISSSATLYTTDLEQRRLTAEKFPELYESVYGEKPLPKWLAQSHATPVTEPLYPPPYEAAGSVLSSASMVAQADPANSAYEMIRNAPRPPDTIPEEPSSNERRGERCAVLV